MSFLFIKYAFSNLQGDTIVLTRQVDANWYEARIGSSRGLVPVNHLHVMREPRSFKMTSHATDDAPKAKGRFIIDIC